MREGFYECEKHTSYWRKKAIEAMPWASKVVAVVGATLASRVGTITNSGVIRNDKKPHHYGVGLNIKNKKKITEEYLEKAIARPSSTALESMLIIT